MVKFVIQRDKPDGWVVNRLEGRWGIETVDTAKAEMGKDELGCSRYPSHSKCYPGSSLIFICPFPSNCRHVQPKNMPAVVNWFCFHSHPLPSHESK